MTFKQQQTEYSFCEANRVITYRFLCCYAVDGNDVIKCKTYFFQLLSKRITYLHTYINRKHNKLQSAAIGC